MHEMWHLCLTPPPKRQAFRLFCWSLAPTAEVDQAYKEDVDPPSWSVKPCCMFQCPWKALEA